MKKVIIGMSGGVDSSVAALKLIEEGYEVEAMFMRNWDSALNNDIIGNDTLDDEVCPQEIDYLDAIKVCEKLNIKLHRIDFVKEYWDNVFEYFIKEYKEGRTPNPDIMCNKFIKFDSFLKESLKLGADYIAMGHYARVKHYEDDVELLRGIDNNKDQTYFLSQLNKYQLSKTLFPIGHLEKSEVRKIAKENDLITADKKDSTGICFIGERDFTKFLSNYIPAQKGKMKTMQNEYVKDHNGLMYYTIGQRKGLEIGGSNKFSNQPWFVVGKDLETNTLFVGQGEDNKYLMSDSCLIEDVNFLKEKVDGNYTAKFRYRQKDTNVKINFTKNNEARIIFEEDIKAVTPGQACVIYKGDLCLGGGIIKEVYKDNKKRMY